MATWIEKQRDKARRDKLSRELTHQSFTPPDNPIGEYLAPRLRDPLGTIAAEVEKYRAMPVGEMATEFGSSGGKLAGLAATFAGRGAKTANLAMLAKAEQLKSVGVPDEAIWKQTGWTLDTPDNVPRFEIPDNAMRVYDDSGAYSKQYADAFATGDKKLIRAARDEFDSYKPPYQRSGTLELDQIMEHPKLGDAYTDLLPYTKYKYNPNSATIGGASYDPVNNTVRMDAISTEGAKSNLGHELQHAIQQREGFARGGSPSQDIVEMTPEYQAWAQSHASLPMSPSGDAVNRSMALYDEIPDKLKAYQRLAGEAEARLTQARMNMTPEQRLAQYPYEPDYFQKETGVNLRDLIVRKDGGTAMSAPYQIEHKPMTIEGGASPLHDLTTSFGDDIYGKNALQYFGSGDTREKATLRILQSMKGKPDAMVTIYRGAPENAGGINAGDWVTLDKSVAQDYVDQALLNEGKAGKVFSQQVPASHVTSWPDSLLEFGYHP